MVSARGRRGDEVAYTHMKDRAKLVGKTEWRIRAGPEGRGDPSGRERVRERSYLKPKQIKSNLYLSIL